VKREKKPGKKKRKQFRGFAAMHPDKQRELASRGGTAVQQKGTGHRWRTADEARDASLKRSRSRSRSRGQTTEIPEAA
jgi:hypothetical protein